MMYDYIEHVLSNYLNADVGHSETEAISMLRADLELSAELAEGLRNDLEKAFLDKSFLWRVALSSNNVFFTDCEKEAFLYAKKMLWSPFFKA